ncbi:uncharacterized protein C8Q71DRAFT_840905 [Rhodofomes roseus]|uniref:Ndc10 domain-containing protein n=1 Tax=Rhodofomes roseus TaxID=34475 RepID=A0ABQ8K521_9APHY|nr:uncharacterized protein C8Q71DRAFT_840905 [Rhodofomes roseus]KAH9832021.1 hypothetical protein C8Q71DRAFT_840905 [Rhodofomes roseus]
MEEAAAPPAVVAIGEQNIDPSLRSQAQHTASLSNVASPPERLPDGRLVPRETYHAYLLSIKRKKCLVGTCASLSISHPKRASLERLRDALLDYWYSPTGNGVAPLPSPPPHTPPPRIPASPTHGTTAATPIHGTAAATPAFALPSTGDETYDGDDELLRNQFYVDCNAAADVFAYDRGAEDGDEEDDELEDATLFSFDMDDPVDFTSYQRSMRVDAAKRFEENRRAGGRRTQKSVIRSWELFLADARADGRVPDEIVDEHSLLVFINYTADRPKRSRKGEYIPGTRVGASQIKKEFFGALRIRKVQDAADPTLATRRPAATVHVYDLVKARMNEALISARLGLIPNEDAPDIVANTFLASVTDQQLQDIGYGFLQHRELRSAINGHLAWTLQNGSGNRGDDVRALKLCELQPYQMKHPNNQQTIFVVLGLQSEEKAGIRNMQTTVNPSYRVWMAHENPLMCPLGALAMHFHQLFDHFRLAEKLDIDWLVNKTWRQVRLIWGSSPTKTYTDSNLHNLYAKAFKKADFESTIKAHLPRHLIGYMQERFGVDPFETSKLGWRHGTYQTTYAPNLPKQANLACHGYMEHEYYDPVWCKVSVPAEFLNRVCPMAESIIKATEGRRNLVGVTNFWKMIVDLRPFLFQCAAAIYQVVPTSPIFRLPALASTDVQEWMKIQYPAHLETAKSQQAEPVDLSRIQNEAQRQALEQMRVILNVIGDKVHSMGETVERRTAVLSPAKGYSNEFSTPPASTLLGSPIQLAPGTRLSGNDLDPPLTISAEARAHEDTGMYEAGDSTLRAFIAPSPKSPSQARPRTQVDLVLPSIQAFNQEGTVQLLWPPCMGQQSVTWAKVFSLIRQPKYLWQAWKPSESLNNMTIAQIWACYNSGEATRDADGNQTGAKPPLRLVEQHFQGKWRSEIEARKAWQRVREIPEWIDTAIRDEGLSDTAAIALLESMRKVEGKAQLLGSNALTSLLIKQRKAKALTAGETLAPASSVASSIVVSSASESTSGKKRRAPTIAGRKKSKKANLHAA